MNLGFGASQLRANRPRCALRGRSRTRPLQLDPSFCTTPPSLRGAHSVRSASGQGLASRYGMCSRG
jgi:hypothetical protein